MKSYLNTLKFMSICKGTLGNHSCPLTTWVVRIKWSSTKCAKWYVGKRSLDEKGYPSISVIESLMTILNSNYEEWRDEHPDVSFLEFPFNP